MPSRLDTAMAATRRNVVLAAVPVVATLLSGSKILRVLAAGPGGGLTFPLPTGLPTLWTYVALPSAAGSGPSIGGPLAVTTFLPLFLVGLVLTAALEAGFLGSIEARLTNGEPSFVANVGRYTGRMIGVNLVRAAIVFVAFPLLLVAPILAVVAIVVLSYLVYGLPYEVVVGDRSVTAALSATVSHARAGGDYATFGVAHLLGGAAASLVLTGVVRTAGWPGILFGTAVVAVPAVFVAVYGVLTFRAVNDPPVPYAN